MVCSLLKPVPVYVMHGVFLLCFFNCINLYAIHSTFLLYCHVLGMKTHGKTFISNHTNRMLYDTFSREEIGRTPMTDFTSSVFACTASHYFLLRGKTVYRHKLDSNPQPGGLYNSVLTTGPSECWWNSEGNNTKVDYVWYIKLND